MSEPILLDASALVAMVFEEPGGDRVEELLTTAFATSVNMAELVIVLNRQGLDGEAVASDLQAAGLAIVPVAWPHWAGLSALEDQHRDSGAKRALSLGDLCCLTYAMQQGMEIVTADRDWALLDLPVPVLLIR